ncbi:pollen-specific leucine-rich repeat extensin-like protein 3 [Glycine soja]|uniref:pollen-specific leucine-rich repeat extensin-like protein 3 n=1 Tax=Glycine soja TaxID=3848 RepID=UPI00103C1A89|nr:pollen-specific leucine-rich repeat extensin-like protein 3 [Glycine soja]
MATFHDCHSPYEASMTAFHGCHSPYGASMAAYHQPHYSSYGTLHYPTQQPPHHLEFSSATEDRLEVALAKLDAATRRLDARLDAFLLQLPRRPGHRYPPQSPCFAPITPSFTPLLPLPLPPLSPPPLPRPWTPPLPPPFPAPPLPPPPLQPTQSPMLTASTTIPTLPPWPTLMPQHPVPLSAPLTIGVVHLPVDSKPQASFPSHDILLSDPSLFPFVMFIAIATDTKLDHHFLPSAITFDAAEWLRFCSTQLHFLIPLPILIWDPGSNFGAMVVTPTP